MTDDESVSAVEHERIERMVASWRESRPSGRAIASARRRFVRATAVTTVTFASLFASFAYGTVGALIAVGGGHVASKWMVARGEEHRTEAISHLEAKASSRPEATPEFALRVEAKAAATALTEGPIEVPEPNPAPEERRSAQQTSERPNGIRRAPAPLPRAPEPFRSRVKTSTTGDDAEIAAAPPAEASAWQRAAAALERHDRVAADQALGELTANPDTHTRDAAWLARAQLWTSQGTPERAAPVLEKLAVGGSTAIIRKRARDLLREAKGSTSP